MTRFTLLNDKLSLLNDQFHLDKTILTLLNDQVDLG